MDVLSAIFFDKQDYELLRMINRILERDRNQPAKYSEKLLEPNLHPNGIKELALSHDMRIAYAVIDLLESLEIGLAEDRLLALKALHDEVLFGTITDFKYNTGRVLIQIMKEIIRAHGDKTAQLKLAHDFRSALSGKPRVIRALLRRYYLLEMPESWEQHAFDDHVHDANTKGRKSPTHLILDAWIKGIRYLTVIYYNYVQPLSVSELMRAAEIMDMKVSVGLEFKGRFRGRYVDIIWRPTGFVDYKDMLSFLGEPPTGHLLRMGQEASRYNEQYVFTMLERYNAVHRLDMEKVFQIALPPIKHEEFLSFVGIGQPSLLHLSELVYKHCLPELEKRREAILAAYPRSSVSERNEYDKLLKRICAMDSSTIEERWLSRELNSDLPDPEVIPLNPAGLPEIMRFSVPSLVDWLTGIRPNSKITLGLGGLHPEDVLELLYDCQGLITHLELFNLKYYRPSESEEIAEINQLQLAVNQDRAVALKRMVLSLLRKYRGLNSQEAAERLQKLLDILKHIQQLNDYYKVSKLEASIGSDSTSRSSRLHGMGFVNLQTLPRRSLMEIRRIQRASGASSCMRIPLYEEINSRVTYYTLQSLPAAASWVSLLRRIPFVRSLVHYQKHEWLAEASLVRFSKEQSNISSLGGLQKDALHKPCRKPEAQALGSGLSYLNTSLRNAVKVVLGFAAAMLTFRYTQSWWVLAWFGALIWFAVTGLRNVVQAVLGGGGFKRSPLLRWNNFVSWSRLCDSLMYTGFSVPLLEYFSKILLLQDTFKINAASSPWIFFAVMSVINGIYISSHNIFRGLPASAVVGNLFRNILAIPAAIFYTWIFKELAILAGAANVDALLMQVSTILSKLASDTLAGVIEGLADRGVNIRMRNWDYHNKLGHLFNAFSRLELLLPEEETVLGALAQAQEYQAKNNEAVVSLKKEIIIDSLDLMYFWLYQPRSRPALKQILATMTREEKQIFCLAQYVLTCEKEVSQLMVDGILGANFTRPLSFYLANVRSYLEDMRKLTQVRVLLPEKLE